MDKIEKIRAEIERLRKNNDISEDECAQYEYDVACGYDMACDAILSFLSTLESEKPMNQNDASKYKNLLINSLRKKRAFPTLKGEQLHKFKNEVNTLKQILQPWQTYGNIQSVLFEKFALAFAVWGGYNLSFKDSISILSDLEKSEKPMNQEGLEKEINKFRTIFKNECDPRIVGEIANHFAQWGAEHLKK